MEVCADLCFTAKSTAWKAIHFCIRHLSLKVNDFVKFPDTSAFDYISTKFKSKQNFPNIVGCVDGTHIKVEVPNVLERETFRNRKGFMSLNCQMICGPDLEIFDIDAGSPGSAHDSRIFRESAVYEKCQALPPQYHLLGDSAYSLEMFMMIPFRNPTERPKSDH